MMALEQTVEYASPGAARARPTHLSAFTIIAWLVLIAEPIYRSSLIAYAYHKSPTYPWERFRRNVGDVDILFNIDRSFFVIGILMAAIGLLHPYRKRWAAWLAFAAHFFLLLTVGGLTTVNRAT
jgi:hypothetical protein